MAWQWPPYIAKTSTRTGFTTQPHYSEIDVSVSGSQLKITPGTLWNAINPYVTTTNGVAYYLHSMAQYSQYGYSYPLSNLYASDLSADQSTAVGTMTGQDGVSYTTTNGVNAVGGADSLGPIQLWVSKDFSNTTAAIAAWKSAGNYFIFKVSDLPSADYAFADATLTGSYENQSVRMVKVGATRYFILWTGLTLSANKFYNTLRYVFFDTSTQTFSAQAALPGFTLDLNQEIGFELFDAGESYFYLSYVTGGNLCVRGIDCSGATPTVTALLGGSGTTTFNGGAGAFDLRTGTANNNRRYVTVGTNRVLAFMANNRFIRITFTQAAKATPTVFTSLRTSTGTGKQIYTEYDPTDTSQFYLVRWSFVEGATFYFYGEYIPVLGTGTSNFQGYQLVYSIVIPDYDFFFSGPFGGSACQGEGSNGILGAFGSRTNGTSDFPTTYTFSFSCWHTPAAYDRTVTITSAYSSVAITNRIVTAQRSVDVTPTAYSSVIVGRAIQSFGADRFQWALSPSSVYEFSVSITSAYTSVSVGAQVLTIVEALPLNQYWLNVGYTWMDDFMTYLNQDRFAVGLPRYKTWGEDGQFLNKIDVAQIQAGQMARYRVFAHESPSQFPAVSATIPIRGDLMPATGFAENIQVYAFFNLATNTYNPTSVTGGFISSYDAWLNWHNSPPHYANIIYNWGEKNDIVYSLVGLEEGLMDPVLGAQYPVLLDYKALYMCNNFASLETVMYELLLNQYWDNSGALISELAQEWSNDSWVHVSARHETPYSLRVASSSFEAKWGCRVAAQHSVPITYSAAAQHTASYEPTAPISPRWIEFPYAVKNTTTIVQQNETKYALQVSNTLTSAYALLLPVKQSNEAGYRIYDTQPVASQHEASFGLKVSRENSATYAMLTPATRQHEATYAVKDTQPVTQQNEASYALRLSTVYGFDYALLSKVTAQSEAAYSIKNTQSVAQQHDAGYALRLSTTYGFDYALLSTVTAQNETGYSIKDTQAVLQQNEAGYSLRLGTAYGFDYALLSTVTAQNETGYSIKNTQSVMRQHEAGFALQVSASIDAPYAVLLPVAARHEANYSIKNTQSLSVQYEATYGLRVSAFSRSDYALLLPVTTQHEAGYSVKNTQSVAQQNDAKYSLRLGTAYNFDYALLSKVAIQNEAGYSIKNTQSVMQQNEASYSLRLSAAYGFGYALLSKVTAQSEAGYSIKDTQSVLHQHDAAYALRVAGSNTASYTLLTSLGAQHEAGYAVKDTQSVAAQTEVPFALRVATQSQGDWAISFSVRAQNEAKYGDVVPVRTQAQIDYALLVNNPLRVQMSHYYAMQDYIAQLAAGNVVTMMLADGQILRVDDGVIDSAAGDVGYTFECSISDISTFANINEDDPIVVNFCGEIYNFYINGKSMTRDGPASVQMRITADNAVLRTGQPYAQEIDYVQENDISASSLVDSLIEIGFNYELVDWTILAGRLQVAGATALETVTQVAAATGGVVDALPDGTMRLRYPYPHPMNDLASAAVDQSYADAYDNLSVTITTEYRDGATKFRVREGDAAFADSLEWVPDEEQVDPLYQTGIVKAYLSPYRSTASISHLGNAAYVIPLGEQIELHEELVEFNEGVGNTRRPIEALLSVEWYTASMGTPAYSPFSTLLNVNPTVNKGYGLAKVRYNAKHLTAKAGGVPATVESSAIGPASSYAYFVLEESNG